MRILVIEDDDIQISLYKQWFISIMENYIQNDINTVEFVTNGSEADSLLSNRTFDLTFLDLMLPGMSGIELYKKHSKNMGCVIVSSSYTEDFFSEISDYSRKMSLNKPFLCKDMRGIMDLAIKEGRIKNADITTDSTGKEYQII